MVKQLVKHDKRYIKVKYVHLKRAHKKLQHRIDILCKRLDDGEHVIVVVWHHGKLWRADNHTHSLKRSSSFQMDGWLKWAIGTAIQIVNFKCLYDKKEGSLQDRSTNMRVLVAFGIIISYVVNLRALLYGVITRFRSSPCFEKNTLNCSVAGQCRSALKVSGDLRSILILVLSVLGSTCMGFTELMYSLKGRRVKALMGGGVSGSLLLIASLESAYCAIIQVPTTEESILLRNKTF
ncbi:hypothetical protein K7X08_025761 [Anisodus acutangulus]|uniref:Uncharacterized protein n=1 Tax=Anisodus acutangulus TaxID=402998 RepID=A0A9Q1LAU3_9SOLA|nr:hypothetical protein K7X08_025761 [Anisodus acutangulus]